MSVGNLTMDKRAKLLYEMTVTELEAEAERYERAGNEMWANLCREQISLHRRVAQSFQRRAHSAGAPTS